MDRSVVLIKINDTMGVVCEEKALPPEGEAGSEVLQGGGDRKSIENLVGGKAKWQISKLT